MLTLRVLTEAGLAFEEPAASVIAPGELGYLGLLPRHAPLVTTLRPGTLTWKRPDGRKETRRIGDGLLEVAKNRVTILTSSVSDTRIGI